MMSLRKLNLVFMYPLAVVAKYVLAKATFVLSDLCVLLSFIGFFALPLCQPLLLGFEWKPILLPWKERLLTFFPSVSAQQIHQCHVHKCSKIVMVMTACKDCDSILFEGVKSDRLDLKCSFSPCTLMKTESSEQCTGRL